MGPPEGDVVLKTSSGSAAERQFKKVKKMLRRLATQSEIERRAGSVPSNCYHNFFQSSAEARVIGSNESVTVASSPDSPHAATSRGRRVDHTFPFAPYSSRTHDSDWRKEISRQKTMFRGYADDEAHSDCTHTRINSAHSTGGGFTSCIQSRKSSPAARNRSRRNVVYAVKSLRRPEATRNSFLHVAAENVTLSLSSGQEGTTWDRRPENYRSEGSIGDTDVSKRQRYIALLDKLALMLSFVAVAACWGIIDMGVELIAHGKARLQILCYAILLLVSLGLIPAAKRLQFVGPCDIAFVASVSFSFLSAVAGWGLVDTIVEYAAGARASVKILYYFCFLLCAIIFVHLHICLLNPSFRLSVACFA